MGILLRLGLARTSANPHQSLFSYFGISLPIAGSTRTVRETIALYFESLRNKKDGHLRPLVTISERNIVQPQFDTQLCLPGFMGESTSTVTRFLPRSRYVYLDYGIYDVFHDTPCLESIVSKLEERQCFYVGNLVQLAETEFRALPFVTEEIFESAAKVLAGMKLTFGMSAPSWQSAHAKLFCR